MNEFILAGIGVLGVNLRLVGIVPFEERSRGVAFFTENTPTEGSPPILFVNEPAAIPPSIPQPIPEPATLLLLSFGLAGLAGLGRKKLFRKA